MNGSTNVQIGTIATLAVAIILGTGRYFFPDFVTSLGSSFPELFTGGVIATLGLLLNHDAGIKSLPGTGASVNSPVLIGVLALLLGTATLTGCEGTVRAYKAAEGLSETAYVVGEHYFAEVRSLNTMDDEGRLTNAELLKVQTIAQNTRPTVVALLDAASAYKNVRSVENEAELATAIADAAVAISKLVKAIKAVGGTAQLEACVNAAQAVDSADGLKYCALIAAR